MNGHNHPPRCCCAWPPEAAPQTPTGRCPECPQHGDLAQLSQRPAPEPVCPHCEAVGDQPHADGCPSRCGWAHAVTPADEPYGYVDGRNVL